MRSFLTHLECTYCKTIFSIEKPLRTCSKCSKVLYPRYDIENAKKEITQAKISTRTPNMWRYFEMLPIINPDNIITLGEGFTPILPINNLGRQLECSNLFIKDEGINPTSSFKARGLSAAVSKAKEFGITKFTIPSAGNAAGALAAYCARGGMKSNIFMPKDTPIANIKEVSIIGSDLTLIDGLINDAGKLSQEKAEKENLFDVSTLKEPYRVEGKKTMGYEIAEQMNWKLPDSIIYPTGGGTGIVGMWKAFDELEQLGWIDSKRPKMFCVQSSGCAPIVKAFLEKTEFAEPWKNAKTIASGLRVPVAIGDYLILDALRSSNGGAVAVEDEDILLETKLIAKLEGMFICPEGGATIKGLKILLDKGQISTDENILLLNTGTGLKYLDIFKD